MNKQLPTLASTDKELEQIYEHHSKRFFHWLETNGIAAHSSRDIALLAHNELVKRSNNRFSFISKVLSLSVLMLSIITAIFAFYDYSGDKEWQKNQLRQLQSINQNLSKIGNQNVQLIKILETTIKDADKLDKAKDE